MDVTQIQDEYGGVFIVKEDGKEVGKMTYKNKPKHIIEIDATKVEPSYEGKGYGQYLVITGARFARATRLKIKASCPFAKTILQASEEYQTLLVEEAKA